jgi:hypothetical protein
MIRPNILKIDALKPLTPPRPKQRIPKRRGRRSAVTVCIAAICTYAGDDMEEWFRWAIDPQPYIIGISDRMISTEHAQSELPRPKFSKIVNSVMGIMAGDIEAQTEVFESTQQYFWNDFYNDPRLIPVKEFAEHYEQDVCTFLNKRRNNIVRRRTGIRTYDDFLRDYQHEDRYEIIDEIKNEPALEMIITGIDESGPHIYMIDHQGISYHDSTGFAIIGSGYLHADSQLMRTRHSINVSYPETLLLTYMAKKQAEINPYVGKETDIFVIKDYTNVDILPPQTIRFLEDTYNKIYKKVFAEALTLTQGHLIDEKTKEIDKRKVPKS